MMMKHIIKQLLNLPMRLVKTLRNLKLIASEEIRRGGPQRYAF